MLNKDLNINIEFMYNRERIVEINNDEQHGGDSL